VLTADMLEMDNYNNYKPAVNAAPQLTVVQYPYTPQWPKNCLAVTALVKIPYKIPVSSGFKLTGALSYAWRLSINKCHQML